MLCTVCTVISNWAVGNPAELPTATFLFASCEAGRLAGCPLEDFVATLRYAMPCHATHLRMQTPTREKKRPPAGKSPPLSYGMRHGTATTAKEGMGKTRHWVRDAAGCEVESCKCSGDRGVDACLSYMAFGGIRVPNPCSRRMVSRRSSFGEALLSLSCLSRHRLLFHLACNTLREVYSTRYMHDTC